MPGRSFATSKCGASIRRNGRKEQCGKIPAEHGTESRTNGLVMIAHSFVLTDQKPNNA